MPGSRRGIRAALWGCIAALWAAGFFVAAELGLLSWVSGSDAGAQVAAAQSCPPESDWPDGMLCIEGGSFRRTAHEASCGHPASKESRYGQQAEITLDAFFVDRTEVTTAQWSACTQACVCPRLSGSLPMADQPQIGVTWREARDFCAAHGKRLLTEAEWDRALRGQDGTAAVGGPGQSTCETAVLKSEAGTACGRAEAWPVSLLIQTAGTSGMVGNAPEWVSDWYAADLDLCGASCSGDNPQGLCAGMDACPDTDKRTLKGGSWAHESSCVFGAHRRAEDPANPTGNGFSFRCGVSASAVAQVRQEPQGAAPLLTGATQPDSWYAADPIYRDWRSSWGVGEGKKTLAIGQVHQTYKDPDMVAHLLQAYHEAFPEITRLETIGKTHHGRSILALEITDPSVPDRDKPAVFLNGAHHGHELLSVEYAMDAIDQLLQGHKAGDPSAMRWIRGLKIWVVPIVNPDGLWLTMNIHHGAGRETLGGRKNGRDIPRTQCDDITRRRGVDLNRNYPYAFDSEGHSKKPDRWNYRGPAGGSEPETQAVMALADKERFVAAITFHTKGSMVITPYTVGGHRNPQPDVAWAVAEKIAPVGFSVKQSMYPVSGTDQDWLYHSFGTLSYILEGDQHNPVSAAARMASVKRVRPSFGRLFDAVLGRGTPRIYGHVRDAAGSPVEAEIRLEGHTLHHGERWTSRPSDGRFDRLLPVGTERVVITALGVGGTQAQAEVSTAAALPLELVVQ